jgi:hypothetical protein
LFPHWSCTSHVLILDFYVFIFESHNLVLFLIWKLDLDLFFSLFSYGFSCPWHSPTWIRARALCNHDDGGGVGFKVDSKLLWEVKMNVIIMCSSYNVSQLAPMYRCKWTRDFCWFFSLRYERKNKHQKGNNKKNAKL